MKYTQEILQAAVTDSTSYCGVLRLLGFQSYSGSMHRHIRSRILKYGIDTSHFKGMRSSLGVAPRNRKAAEEIFESGSKTRAKTHQLRRALIESGVPHVCAVCGQGPEWNNRPLVLPIDHEDGDWTNNTKGNLRFLCPNCHTQTPTFGRRSK